MMRPLTIGIAGGTGSGKTTLVNQLVDFFPNDISVIYHDNYYRAHDNLTMAQRDRLNFDHPDAFETELLIDDLKKLQSGQTISCPIYDYSLHTRSKHITKIKAKPVIIIEGILIFAHSKLRNLLDIKIFVETDADTRILRRILRDVDQRERSLDSVINQYLTTVKPMHKQFVEPSKQYADIIIPEGGRNPVPKDMLIETIAAHIRRTRHKADTDLKPPL